MDRHGNNNYVLMQTINTMKPQWKCKVKEMYVYWIVFLRCFVFKTAIKIQCSTESETKLKTRAVCAAELALASLGPSAKFWPQSCVNPCCPVQIITLTW